MLENLEPSSERLPIESLWVHQGWIVNLDHILQCLKAKE